MGLIGIRTHIAFQVSKVISTYPWTWDYLNLGLIDTRPNIKGYPNISLDIGLLELKTRKYKSKYQRISLPILGHGITWTNDSYTSLSIKGYPNISWEMGLNQLRTGRYNSKFQSISQHIQVYGTP